MREVSFRGGAQVGWVSASWPFAKLVVREQELTLACLGRYTFAASDVVALEPHGIVPLIGQGIRIRHNRVDYPERLIFWCMGSRARALAAVKQAGFSPSGQASGRAPGFALRWSVVATVILLWNLLFLLDRSAANPQTQAPGPFAMLAMLGLFAGATWVQVSPRLQRLVLRDGHDACEIKSLLILIRIVAGGLSLVMASTLLSRGG